MSAADILLSPAHTCPYASSTTYAPLCFLSSLFFIFFSDDIICYSKKLGRICAADGETFEFLSMYNLWHFSSSPFSPSDLSIHAFSRNVCFGRLSINHVKPALVFPLEALSSLTYVIIHCALPNFLLGKHRDALTVRSRFFYFVAHSVGDIGNLVSRNESQLHTRSILAAIFRCHEDFKKSCLKSVIFILCRIFYDNPLRNEDFLLSDDERDALLFRGELLSCKPMQAAFPMVPLSVRAWIITTVSFSGTCNSLEASSQDAESRNVCIEDCSRDLNGWIFLSGFPNDLS